MTNTNRTEYKNNWQKEHTDRISLTVPKGQKAELQDHAERRGESLNTFIKRAIQEAVERDTESDNIERIAREREIPFETAYKYVEIGKAIRVLESTFPGIQKLYVSNQLADMIRDRNKPIVTCIESV